MAQVRRWFERIEGSLVGLLGLLLLAGFTYEQMGRATDVNRLPPRMGQAIDIGERT